MEQRQEQVMAAVDGKKVCEQLGGVAWAGLAGKEPLLHAAWAGEESREQAIGTGRVASHLISRRLRFASGRGRAGGLLYICRRATLVKARRLIPDEEDTATRATDTSRPCPSEKRATAFVLTATAALLPSLTSPTDRNGACVKERLFPISRRVFA